MMTYRNVSLTMGFLTVAVFASVLSVVIFRSQETDWWRSALFLVIPTFSLCFVWGLIAYAERRLPLSDRSEGERRQFVYSLLGGALILVGAVTMTVLHTFDVLEGELSKRIWGVYMGVFLIAIGNYAPKFVPSRKSLSQSKWPEQVTQSVQRFVGKSLFAAGIGAVGAWLILPVDQANMVASLFCLAAVGLTLIRLYFAHRTSKRNLNSAEPRP